jgi:tetratricopeptide (TPR) repeat protein
METEARTSDTTSWLQFSDRLRRELASTRDSSKRVSILHALSRVLEGIPKSTDEAIGFLEAALQSDPSSRSLSWDAWRIAGSRGPEHRIAALKRLSQVLEKPEDIVSLKLWLARLVKDHIGDEKRFLNLLEEAAGILPAHRGLLWELAEYSAGRGDSRALAQNLEKLAGATQDSALRSAFLLETADIERETAANRDRVADLLKESLDEPGADWSIASAALFLSAEIGDWQIYENALEKMAGAALLSEPEPDPGRPAGHLFQGFDRGKSAAAAIWWQISTVRERRKGNAEAALDAVERARELLPDHPFLEIERVRLLEACERPEQAFNEAPDDVSDLWKAELALAAGHPEWALPFVSAGSDVRATRLGKAIACASGAEDDLIPETDDDTEKLLTWFQAYPGRAEALQIAAKLKEIGVDIPAVRLALWENTPTGGKWPDVVVGGTDEPWPAAVEAALGSGEISGGDRGQAFIYWAKRTADLTLKATFFSIAARLKEREGGSKEEALDLFKRAEDLDPEATDHMTEVMRLMHLLGKWSELAERLADDAAIIEDSKRARAALHERAIILDYELNNPVEAAESISEIISCEPNDVSAAWFAARLAFKLADWQLVVRELDRLISLCPEDSAFFNLLSGEIELFSIGNYEEAFHFFERAAEAEDPAIAQTARLYCFYVLYQLGDLEALQEALTREERAATGNLKQMWLPELLEIGRATGRAGEVLDEIEKTDKKANLKTLWRLMCEVDVSDSGSVKESMQSLAGLASPGIIAGACRTAGALFAEQYSEMEEALGEEGLKSQEGLWHAADRLNLRVDLANAVRIYKERASMVGSGDDLEWVDWILYKAEAEEKSGKIAQALTTVDEALYRMEEHPGLLEAKARLSRAAGNWPEAVDAHKRLTKFYVSEDEKANQMAKVASLLYEKLGDRKSAQAICEKVLTRVPDHAETFEILVRIHKERGDEGAVSRLLEKRIGAEQDFDELAKLYEEQADQMLGMDNSGEALEALDNLIVVDPDRLSAYLTKVEILAEINRWGEAIATMREYIDRSDDPVEVRTMTWRAADLLVQEVKDAGAALAMLRQLVDRGDRHPSTLRQIVEIAKTSENWDEAAWGLSKLAELVEDENERVKAKREEAVIRLERLFDDDAADGLVKDILSACPADLPTLKLYSQFRPVEETENAIAEAIKSVRDELQKNPTDLGLIETLRELADLGFLKDVSRLCDDVITLFSGGEVEPWPGDLVPGSDLDAEMQRRFFVHPDEKNTASRVAEMASAIAQNVLPPLGDLPKLKRGALITAKDDNPVRSWIESWTKLLGYEGVEVYMAGDDTRGSVALPTNTPAVAITSSVKSPLTAKHRFFLARNIWRSGRGHAVFEEGDATGPVEWVVAMAAAILGERIELPMPVDREMVAKAKKATPRRLRHGLTEACNLLLGESRQSLRAWAQAISYSADRFGLLAATRIVEVMPLIVEECAGSDGLQKYAEDPSATIRKIPRCLELLRFALSEEYLAARRKIGLNIKDSGGGR